jgi:hypothetical protein
MRFAAAIVAFGSASLLLTIWILDGSPPIGLVLLVSSVASFIGLVGPKLKVRSVGMKGS